MLLIFIIILNFKNKQYRDLSNFNYFNFLIHPYSVLPWPDYFSGISLSLFFFYFLKENSKYNLFLSAIFLFLAIFFRSTYILNIIFSIFIYFLLFEFYKKKNIF